MKSLLSNTIDYIEIFCPSAKLMAYWHVHALNFKIVGCSNAESAKSGDSSYVLQSSEVKLVISSAYATSKIVNSEILDFVTKNHCGVKRIAFHVSDVKTSFYECLEMGGIPIQFPVKSCDDFGHIEEASIKLYDNSEITFINRDEYQGVFKPGYQLVSEPAVDQNSLFTSIDHIASEVRINESAYWCNYLNNTIGTNLVQSILRSESNKTGMILNICQSDDNKITFVLAEPDGRESRVQKNIDTFGPGIHHIAFTTDNLIKTTKTLIDNGVEFVSYPSSYYDLLRSDKDFENIDVDLLQNLNILCDKEGDTYLYQKFIKPISDRPFFIYEVVERVNGYQGFALKNINVLKRSEEIEIMKS